MYLTVQALVLRVTDYNDRDALLTLLTREHGKITAKARGLRRKNSPLVAPCQLLAFGEFTLFEYRGMYTINEASSVELFRELHTDLQKLSLGTYFAQVADVISQEDDPNPELLSLVLNCLYALSRLSLSETTIKTVFELRSVCLAGYSPDLSGCHVCGAEQGVYLDLSGGTLLCNNCSGYSSGIRYPVDREMLQIMVYLSCCSAKKIFAFRAGEACLQRLSSLTEAYLTTQLERGFPALDFYKSLLI